MGQAYKVGQEVQKDPLVGLGRPYDCYDHFGTGLDFHDMGAGEG
jgi:hypothetical protein